jgi:hypothetical protein
MDLTGSVVCKERCSYAALIIHSNDDAVWRVMVVKQCQNILSMTEQEPVMSRFVLLFE